METFAIIVSICSGLLCISNAVSLIILKIQGLKRIKEGLKCILRSKILETYYRYEKDAELPQYARENVDSLFGAYVGLGGNSFIIDVHDRIREWNIISEKQKGEK